MKTRRRWAGPMALVAVAAALARALPAGAVIIPPTLLTVTPNATLKSGAIVTVSGSGFDATPQTVYLAQCPAGAVSRPSDCDNLVSLYVDSPNFVSFTTTFTVTRFITTSAAGTVAAVRRLVRA